MVSKEVPAVVLKRIERLRCAPLQQTNQPLAVAKFPV
jgi:hypothetical protein